MLNAELFSGVIKSAPLISIDLIVKNKEEKILLGKRVNEPAQGFWFVPGGRIFKDEKMSEAFSRICVSELNIDLSINEAKFHGTYEHFYKNNVFNDDFSTHYVVLAYEITLNDELDLPTDQHSDYLWLDIEIAIDRDDVHQYTKNYFIEDM